MSRSATAAATSTTHTTAAVASATTDANGLGTSGVQDFVWDDVFHQPMEHRDLDCPDSLLRGKGLTAEDMVDKLAMFGVRSALEEIGVKGYTGHLRKKGAHR
tara:strand:- start:420 stop:725 length:306 start_codon:yes stop_codon:yes gene_type:complete